MTARPHDFFLPVFDGYFGECPNDHDHTLIHLQYIQSVPYLHLPSLRLLCLARLKSWCRAPCLASRKHSRWQHTPVPRSFLTGSKVWPELKSNRTLKSHSISSRFHPDEATNIRDMLVTRHAELRLRIHGAVRSPVHMAPRTLMDSRASCPHSALSLPQCDPTRPCVLHFAFPPLHVHGRPGGWRIGLRENRHRGHPGGRAACPRQLPPPLLRLQELPTGTGSGPASRSLGPLPLPATSPVHHLDGGSVSLNADARSHLVMFLSTHFAPHTSFWWFLWLPRLMGVRRPLQR